MRNSIHKVINKLNINVGNINRNDQSGALHRAWGHIYTNHIRGDYVEFGVYQGSSMTSSYTNYSQFKLWLDQQVRSNEAWRRQLFADFQDYMPVFHGLDTFEGMPENNEENRLFGADTFMSNYESVRSLISKTIPEQQYRLYKGLFNDTSDELVLNLKDNIAIAHIDADLYFSARDALNIIKSRIQTGTVILFDDYNAFNADKNKGERLAFKEFRADFHLEFESWFSYGYSGHAFLCIG